MAKKLVDEIAHVSSSYIGAQMEVIPPKIIEVGKIATVRTSPSVKKNADVYKRQIRYRATGYDNCLNPEVILAELLLSLIHIWYQSS